MKQFKLEFLKFLDRFFGTPLAYFWGALNRLADRPDLNPEDVDKILITKWIGMGDVILTLPAVKKLRERYPDAHIAYFTTPRGAVIMQGVSEIDELISYGISSKHGSLGDFLNLLNHLKQSDFDIAIELLQSYRLPSLMHYLAKIPHRIGFDIKGQGRNYLLTDGVPYSEERYEAESFLDILEIVDIESKKIDFPELKFPKDTLSEALLKEVDQLNKPITTLHIGVGPSLPERAWPAEHFAELANKLKERGLTETVILTGSEKESEKAEKIIKTSSAEIKDLTGETTIPDLHEVFKASNVVVTADTGPLHLSIISQAPTIALFGPSNDQKWGPRGSQHRIIKESEHMSDISPYQISQIIKGIQE